VSYGDRARQILELRRIVAAVFHELTPARRLYNVTAVVDGYRTVFEWKRIEWPGDAGTFTLLNLPARFLEHPNEAAAVAPPPNAGASGAEGGVPT